MVRVRSCFAGISLFIETKSGVNGVNESRIAQRVQRNVRIVLCLKLKVQKNSWISTSRSLTPATRLQS